MAIAKSTQDKLDAISAALDAAATGLAQDIRHCLSLTDRRRLRRVVYLGLLPMTILIAVGSFPFNSFVLWTGQAIPSADMASPRLRSASTDVSFSGPIYALRPVAADCPAVAPATVVTMSPNCDSMRSHPADFNVASMSVASAIDSALGYTLKLNFWPANDRRASEMRLRCASDILRSAFRNVSSWTSYTWARTSNTPSRNNAPNPRYVNNFAYADVAGNESHPGKGIESYRQLILGVAAFILLAFRLGVYWSKRR